ncbi:sensor histidine kinase [Pseudothermotoga thermarum]|uniref:histidine kinase n=1 Tax=Pseudothermotoga thermarum DSM 5069 TaxID=688269 RepID=F7YX26_9THEM|nr:ATP-binding protein [Pseudothermotoga thermarum]AEH50660.1 PAS/PAC sensor signal transduction histidine kinase [Pseudothermotoga thermarum DSM 5069]
MLVAFLIAISIIVALVVYEIASHWKIRDYKKFFQRVAELAGVSEDSPPIHILQQLRNRIAMLEEELAAVQKSRENVLTLLDNVVDPIFFVQVDGEIIFANKAAEMISRSAVVSKKIHEVLEDYFLIEMFDETVRTWQVQEANVMLYVNGRKRYFSCKMIPVSLSKSEKRIVILMHDITKEHELNEMRKEFVSNVSHELRTPLTSIHGYAETLLNDPDIDPETRQRFLSIIENEAARMTRLINDLLDLERLESGEARFEFQPVDLCSVIKYVLSIVEPLAVQYGVKVEYSCQDIVLEADQDRLIQMLVNLVDNAVKYTSLKETGEKQVKVSAKLQDESVVIKVEDTGPGIPKNALERIFDRFYRVDKGRSRKMGGAGLGLSIVKTIVDRHNGKIYVESEVGVGTTFTVVLPVKQGERKDENVRYHQKEA